MHSRYDTTFRYSPDSVIELDDLNSHTVRVHSSHQLGQRTVRIYSNGLGVASLSIEQARIMRDALDDIIHTAESAPD